MLRGSRNGMINGAGPPKQGENVRAVGRGSLELPWLRLGGRLDQFHVELAAVAGISWTSFASSVCAVVISVYDIIVRPRSIPKSDHSGYSGCQTTRFEKMDMRCGEDNGEFQIAQPLIDHG